MRTEGQWREREGKEGEMPLIWYLIIRRGQNSKEREKREEKKKIGKCVYKKTSTSLTINACYVSSHSQKCPWRGVDDGKGAKQLV